MKPKTLYDKLWESHVVRKNGRHGALYRSSSGPRGDLAAGVRGFAPGASAGVAGASPTWRPPDHNVPTTDRSRASPTRCRGCRSRRWNRTAPSSRSSSSA